MTRTRGHCGGRGNRRNRGSRGFGAAAVITAALLVLATGCSGGGSDTPEAAASTSASAAPDGPGAHGAPGAPTTAPVSGSPVPVVPAGAGGIPSARTLPLGADGLPVVFDNGPRSKPRVALTFDSDMTAGMQERLRTGKTASYDNTALLADLRRMKVPATFFMTGLWIDTYPQEAKGIATDPLFEVASHSLTHRGFAGQCYGLGHVPTEQMAAEVRAPFDRLKAVPGARTVPYFRFPGGCYDKTALQAIAPTGVTPVQWDVVSGDADGATGDKIAATVLAQVKNGSVVVMHNSLGPAAHTADAVPKIVEGLRAKGFEIVLVSDLVGETVGQTAAG